MEATPPRRPLGARCCRFISPLPRPVPLGKLTSVTLTGNALAPVSGIFSPDNTIFFAGTTGDNQLHLIDTTTLVDTKTDQPQAHGYQWQSVAAGVSRGQAETDYLMLEGHGGQVG